jgi:hypothetical protein
MIEYCSVVWLFDLYVTDPYTSGQRLWLLLRERDILRNRHSSMH